MLIRKKFKFEMAHRLVSSYSTRCQSIHGHSYTVDVVLKGETLNNDEMLIDFGEVKAEMAEFLDVFDHTMVLAEHDPYRDRLMAIMIEGKMRCMVVSYNPTAERMAEHIFKEFAGRGFNLERVRVHETLTGWAECTSVNYSDKLEIVELHNV